jgi:hypothetical protein
MFVPSFVPILVSSSSDDDNEDENPPPPAHLPPNESIEHEPTPAPPSSLLSQVSETHDPETFAEASGHLDWDTTMNEEYHSLMVNDTWDLVPL